MRPPPFSFHVKTWAAWSSEREADADWLAWANGAPTVMPQEQPAAAKAPQLLRRRVSGLGQKALQAAWGSPASSSARFVFSSRHGEFSRTLSLMDALAREDQVSPADFSLSVHHALAGLLSIATGNRRGHTAIAAGKESFFYGLLEALGCLAETPECPVVLVHYDERLPAPFDHFDSPGDETIAMALTLTTEKVGPAMRLAITPVTGNQSTSATPAHDFLGFFLGQRQQAVICGDAQALAFGESRCGSLIIGGGWGRPARPSPSFSWAAAFSR